MDAVRILRGDREVKLILDPMRREILRLLARKTWTGADLSESLGLSAPTVGHHLAALRKGGLIEMVRAEPGDHGIVQKFYRAVAQVFIIESKDLSSVVQRYLLPARIERTRGMIAALYLSNGKGYKFSSHSVETITRELSKHVLEEAENLRGPSLGGDPEELINRIYVQALRSLIKTQPSLLPPISIPAD